MSEKWDQRFMQMAALLASWSSDPRKQVGCILVDELHRVVATGFNGPPRGVDDVAEDDRLSVTIHAEVNAVLQAQRSFYTAYVWPVLPCSMCTAVLVQAGVQRIVSRREPAEKWRWDLGQHICDIHNIEVSLC